MNQETTMSSAEVSFKDFLFNNKRNRTILWLAAAAIVIQFAVFKYFYPFASYIHGDSFSYIKAADQNLNINTYPIGYSKFLRLFSVFAKPDYVLTSFQYLLIQSSILFLLFTFFYFYKTGKGMQFLLLGFMLFNPLFLHLGNLVSSDNLFLSISCIWFGLLLWIIHRPTIKIIICNSIILLIAFTVRYNAMIYPFIMLIALWLSNLPLRKKIFGLGLSLMLCGIFTSFTMYQYKKLTGYWQFSPFSGWQFANNAMYAYRYVHIADRHPVPLKFQELDNMIRVFFDSTRDTKKNPSENLKASSVYMWTRRMPLWKYRNNLFKNDTTSIELKKWASMGPFYKDYGIFIIKQYPIYFLKYFIYPNALKYYAPPVEFLDVYNSYRKSVAPEASKWFGYDSNNVKTRMKDNNVLVLNFYPILSGMINVSILCLLIIYLTWKGWTYSKPFQKGLTIGGAFWLCNALFTIFASPAALRFQAFPIILTTILVCLLTDFMFQIMGKLKTEKDSYIRVQVPKNKLVATNPSA
ncbi:hypothetical protein A4H97_32005 [Niastella yeongjuensis]|uniref:Glycosyltransferase RgtA/B/C/D-like domain-containing protein n=1 Tax=Niastella yeongjuensis TaxID=354355 RepID=A0A1V9EIA6_9BACT|nr:hypothetical protein [Niastella yeongjuensis]OQP45868.1 hypothetical protein A4H97_32005 [Niastella yeongjuensis]SEP46704.1 hypothetical protein SAMN05660816_06484 [Niastella yeongjuensis]